MTNDHAEKFDRLFTTFLRSTAEGRETLRRRFAGDVTPYRELRDLYWEYLEVYDLRATELALSIVIVKWRKETIAPIARIIKATKRVAQQQVYPRVQEEQA